MKSFTSTFFLLLSIFFITSCGSQKQLQQTEKELTIQTYEDKRGRVNLIGEINQQALQTEVFSWYQDRYDSYTPNEAVVKELKKPLKEYQIEAFFGTWCGDSKRDVPKFFKILDATDFSPTNLTVIAVGNEGSLYKKSPGGETDGKDITNVPTFIFYKDGVEVNRIVENAVGSSLEADMLAIVTGEGYKHKYADF